MDQRTGLQGLFYLHMPAMHTSIPLTSVLASNPPSPLLLYPPPPPPQAARVIAMDRERLRSGDRACVRFRFLNHPEFLTPGTRFVFRCARSARGSHSGRLLSPIPQGLLLCCPRSSPCVVHDDRRGGVVRAVLAWL